MHAIHTARAHLAAGEPAPALRILTDHLSIHADDSHAWEDAAEAMLGIDKPEAAIDAATQAFRRRRCSASAALLAVTLAKAGRASDALELIERILAEPVRDPATWERLARAFEAVGQADAGVTARREAHRISPEDLGITVRLAERLERAGRRDEARALAVRCGPAAERLLIRLDHHEGLLESAADRANRLLSQAALPTRERSSLLIELARIEAQRSRPDEAFEAASEGNSASLEMWVADHGADLDALPRSLERLLASPTPHLPDPAISPEMGFIVGFPRSGTTLVHQILQAHPEVLALDELPLVDGALADVLPGLDLADATARVGDPIVAERVRDAWWERVRARATPDERLVIDKLPLNLLRIELIAQVFPGAPIVAVLRDPRDAVLSAFFQDFKLNGAMAQCADIVRCASLYAKAFELWLRVRDRLPRAVELRYEALIHAPEATLRPVLATLGLPWDERVLNHTAAVKVTETPSYRDVRKPLYAGQIGRWRQFATQIAPALPILAPYIDALGYPAS